MEWSKGVLEWASTAKTWLLPVATFVAGVLLKPLQDEVGRRISLRNEVRTARVNIYKEIAWNIRLVMNDQWLASHAVVADDIETKAYEKVKDSGLIHEIREGAELRDCMEFFIAFRKLGLVGGTSLAKAADLIGQYLIGLDDALQSGRMSVKLLKEISRPKEQVLIDRFMQEAADVRAKKEDDVKNESRAYLAKRQKPQTSRESKPPS